MRCSSGAVSRPASKPQEQDEAALLERSGRVFSSAIVFDVSAWAVLLEAVDGRLRGRLAGIALGREHGLGIILERHAKLAALVLRDHELVRHVRLLPAET